MCFVFFHKWSEWKRGTATAHGFLLPIKGVEMEVRYRECKECLKREVKQINN